MPTDPAEPQPVRAESRLERTHELGAELIAGFFPRDDPERSGSRASPVSIQGRSTDDKEDPQAVGRAQALVLLEQERRPGPHRDARKAGSRDLDDGPGTDRGHVDAQVLTALGGLDEHAASLPARSGRRTTRRAGVARG